MIKLPITLFKKERQTGSGSDSKRTKWKTNKETAGFNK